MCVKVFLLGLPGSGKTAAAHYISMIARDRGYTVKDFNDYNILREKFENATDRKQFSPAENGSFHVLDYTVLDTSLQEIEQQILQKTLSDKEMVIIEFARNNYLHALQKFSALFLRNSYFLFIDAEDTTCRERVYTRYTHYLSSDDHFVSDETFDKHYDRGRDYHILSDINRICDSNEIRYDLDVRKIAIINNSQSTSIDEFYSKTEQIALLMIEQKDIVLQEDEVFLCN